MNINQRAVGAKSVYTKTHIRERQEAGEFYLCALRNTKNTRTDGKSVTLGWEIAKSGGSHTFYPLIHIRYPTGTTNYPDDEYKQTLTNMPVSQNAWHTLQITNDTSSNTWWKLYLDGVYITKVWWPYPNDDEPRTQVEGFWNTTPYWYMGHHSYVKFQRNGTWYYQDSAWPATWSTSYFAAHVLTPYYDWEGYK